MLAAVKLQASFTYEAINYLSSIRDNGWNLSHFHFSFPLLRFRYETICCESFFWLLLHFSYESMILISEKYIAKIVKASIVKTVKMQAALPKRKFCPEYFLVIFRVSVLSKCFEKSITIWLDETRLHHQGFLEFVICWFVMIFFRDKKSIFL